MSAQQTHDQDRLEEARLIRSFCYGVCPTCGAEPVQRCMDPMSRVFLEAIHITRLLAKEQAPVCARAEDHLAHSIPMSVSCPGVGEQKCDPAKYQHLGPWERVKPFSEVEECKACGEMIGK